MKIIHMHILHEFDKSVNCFPRPGFHLAILIVAFFISDLSEITEWFSNFPILCSFHLCIFQKLRVFNLSFNYIDFLFLLCIFKFSLFCTFSLLNMFCSFLRDKQNCLISIKEFVVLKIFSLQSLQVFF